MPELAPAQTLGAASAPPAAAAAAGAASPPPAGGAGPAGQLRALLVISSGVFCSLSIWFVASAVLRPLKAEWEISDAEGSFLTSVVNFGFCVGCLLSALLNVADMYAPPAVILVGSLGAAAANASLLLVGGLAGALLARFGVGLALSLVYPPAVKLLSTWYSAEQRSGAIGVMFSFFCMGSAFPQLLYGLAEGFSWRAVVVSTSGLAVASGVSVYSFVEIGPFPFPSSKFDVQKMLGICRNRNVMLSIAAYCGHQWELFCVWAWCAQFLENIHGLSHTGAHVWAFVVISMGGPGSWLGGRLGDKHGRVRTALVTVAVSGACTLVLGLLDDHWPFPIWIAICLVWGLASLADSPNYSALVTINADQESVGTAVTFQLFCGYSITILSLWLVPTLSSAWSWRWSLTSLCAGPAMSVVALWALEPKQSAEKHAERGLAQDLAEQGIGRALRGGA